MYECFGYMCVGAPHACLVPVVWSDEGVTGIMYDCDPSYGFWKLKSGPLQE